MCFVCYIKWSSILVCTYLLQIWCNLPNKKWLYMYLQKQCKYILYTITIEQFDYRGLKLSNISDWDTHFNKIGWISERKSQIILKNDASIHGFQYVFITTLSNDGLDWLEFFMCSSSSSIVGFWLDNSGVDSELKDPFW